MRPQYALPKLLIAVLLAGRVLPALGAEPSLPAATVADGAIVGIVTNSAKVPVAGATVTAVKSNGGGIRATISGSDGVYSFADVPVGSWVITVPCRWDARRRCAGARGDRGQGEQERPRDERPGSAAAGSAGGGSGTRTRRGGREAAKAARPARPGRRSDGADGTRGAAGAGTRPRERHRHPVCQRRGYRLDERHLAREVADLRYEVLHARDPPGRELPAKPQPPERPYDRRLDRGVPLGGISDRAGELRRRLPLEQRESALSLDVRHVRDDHAAQ